MVLCSWIDFADLWPLHFLQKIMHTRKRHQDMFQDLNRKLQHAEKEKESPTTDSKVSHTPLEPSPPGDTLVPAGAWEHLGALAECLTLSFVYKHMQPQWTWRVTKVPLDYLQIIIPDGKKYFLMSVHYVWSLFSCLCLFPMFVSVLCC